MSEEESFESKRARMRRESETGTPSVPEPSYEEKRRQIYSALHKQYGAYWMLETGTWYPVDNP